MHVPTEDLIRDRSRAAVSTRRGCALLAIAMATLPAWSAAADSQYPRMAIIGQYLMTDKASEVALARTAAPKLVSDKATVLTLGKDGYETAVKGTNGFVCLIFRSWSNDFDSTQFWNTKIRTPQCWNAAAASSWLPDYLARTKWALSGVSKDEMAARTKAGLASHEIHMPAPGSMAYMLSKDQYINDPSPEAGPARWYPHVMFFVPATDGSPWGADVPGGAIGSNTSDSEPITTYFVRVPKWSDGTLGPYTASSGKPQEHHHHG